MSLVNIDGVNLTIKASGLLEKLVSVFSPRRRIAMAASEAEAKIITAEAELSIERRRLESELDMADIRARAAKRSLGEEIRHQENIEDIVLRALPGVTEDAMPEAIEDDWVSHFFERCRNVTNAEMQSLWSRILSGEANTPGFFSKRLLDLLASLDRSEGLAFSSLCNFGLGSRNSLLPIVTDPTAEIYVAHGLTWARLEHLQTIGLITFAGVMEYHKEMPEQIVGGAYFGKHIRSTWPSAGFKVPMGKVVLSASGKQLSTVCERIEIAGFVDHLMGYWRMNGATVELVQ